MMAVLLIVLGVVALLVAALCGLALAVRYAFTATETASLRRQREQAAPARLEDYLTHRGDDRLFSARNGYDVDLYDVSGWPLASEHRRTAAGALRLGADWDRAAVTSNDRTQAWIHINWRQR